MGGLKYIFINVDWHTRTKKSEQDNSDVAILY